MYRSVVLNIAAGKPDLIPEGYGKNDFIVNIDTMYLDSISPIECEQEYQNWLHHNQDATLNRYKNLKVGFDVFEFMERTTIPFDNILIYRFLEHVTFTNVLYFIYLLSTNITKGGTLDIIVPNYDTLARRILAENPFDKKENFEAVNIINTTELLNEPSCPHSSIWNPKRARYFFELEKRFKVRKIDTEYTFDGRDIYMRFFAERI